MPSFKFQDAAALRSKEMKGGYLLVRRTENTVLDLDQFASIFIYSLIMDFSSFI